MERSSPTLIARLLLAGLCASLSIPSAFSQASIRSVKILGSKDSVEIEVEASDRVVPQTQVLTGPDRLVIDFPNTTPGSGLRNQSVERGQVKDIRFGLFQAKPPVTRIVLDLQSTQSFQVFPYGRTVMIKLAGSGAEVEGSTADSVSATRPGLVTANYVNRAEPFGSDASNYVPAVPAKPLEVSFRDGLLAIHSNKATLSEVLYAVQQRTGAEVSIAAGAEQEKVVADIGPAPAPEVLAQLLNGSKFNFLILNAANDPRQLDRIILSPRPEHVYSSAPAQNQTVQADDDDTSAAAQAAPTPQPNRAPARVAPVPPVEQDQAESKPEQPTPEQ